MFADGEVFWSLIKRADLGERRKSPGADASGGLYSGPVSDIRFALAGRRQRIPSRGYWSFGPFCVRASGYSMAISAGLVCCAQGLRGRCPVACGLVAQLVRAHA